ncbi:hypothetical protein CLU96_2683 [Chryseobacterium sp. 52]|uniref:helix-turn-helix domain-containing protein n=1 Tax=Chryseobacterium sp. 52 TaxID=2035213 RepID=UPI000C19F6A0|nr:helix-turn-helix domain-containing protein [Chryseobacterium sp. 52]PIF45674.1 hypothetical protein CLU96_2683 [Chryseobacterium sp. 52]
MEHKRPDYKRIYNDIIAEKYPHKSADCQGILEKKELSVLDIIKLNTLIFDNKDKETKVFNNRHRSYNKSGILEILDYQKKNKLNNTEVASHFNLSRSTITKWKKLFLQTRV